MSSKIECAREHHREYQREYYRTKQQTDPDYKLKNQINAKMYYRKKNNLDINTKEPLSDWALWMEDITNKAMFKWNNETVPEINRLYREKQINDLKTKQMNKSS